MPQHLWAEVSEKLSDIIDKEIKYGGGPDAIAIPLGKGSENVKHLEIGEGLLEQILSKSDQIRNLMADHSISEELRQEIVDMQMQVEETRNKLMANRQRLVDGMNDAIFKLKSLKETA